MHQAIRTIVVALLACAALAVGARAGPSEDVGNLEVLVVTSGSGEPIPKAEVTLSASTSEGITMYPRDTDVKGRARFERQALGKYGLEVKLKGYTCAFREGVEVSKATATLRVELEPGVPFSGSVRTQSGEPVGLASVVARAGGVFDGVTVRKPRHAPYAKVSTDREGLFHVPGIPNDSIATLIVRARGHAEARVAVRAIGGTVRPAPLTIVLPPGGRVAGVVADPEGKPVPGASVYVIPDGDEALREDPRTRLLQGDWGDGCLDAEPTDGKGRFAVDGLALNRKYLVCAYAPGFVRSEWVGPLVVTTAGEKVKATLALRADTSAGRGAR